MRIILLFVALLALASDAWALGGETDPMSVINQAVSSAVITKSDSTVLSPTTRALFIGDATACNVAVKLQNDSAAVTALTNCWGGAAGATNLGSIAANQATYLGTLYATANGQTGMQFTPAAASGGSNAILGLYNAYNRVVYGSRSLDSAASWTYALATWRAADASNSNRISYVDGLGQSAPTGSYSDFAELNGSIDASIGVNLNSTSASPPCAGRKISAADVFEQITTTACTFSPALGLNFIQAMEFNFSASTTLTFYGSGGAGNSMVLTASVDM